MDYLTIGGSYKGDLYGETAARAATDPEFRAFLRRSNAQSRPDAFDKQIEGMLAAGLGPRAARGGTNSKIGRFDSVHVGNQGYDRALKSARRNAGNLGPQSRPSECMTRRQARFSASSP